MEIEICRNVSFLSLAVNALECLKSSVWRSQGNSVCRTSLATPGPKNMSVKYIISLKTIWLNEEKNLDKEEKPYENIIIRQ